MSKPATIILTIILILSFGNGFSEDLYLLNIGSTSDLNEATRIVHHARGRLGDGFIVELDDVQYDRLIDAGLSPRLIAENVDPGRLYVLSPGNRRIQKSPLYVTSLASQGDQDIAELDQASVDVLRKSGYMTVPLGDLQTPLFYSPPVTMAGFDEIYPRDSLADMVSQDSLYSYDTRLENFYTRHVYSDSIRLARDWLIAKFQEFGYTDVTTDTFYYNGTPCNNVICFKEGYSEPDKIIVVGGHYDSYNTHTDPTIFAPGADDNASGTSAVLELARIFKDVDTKKSIMFCAFSAEEVGLIGSGVIAGRLYSEGADLECMLNFDMVAFNEDAYENVAIFNGYSPVYAYVLRDAAERVTTLIPELRGSSGSSDHVPFNNYGYMVGYVQEGDFNFAGWHTDIDISSRLNFPYFEQVVRMITAAVGHIDISTGVTPIDVIRDAGDGHTLRLEWNRCNPSYTYKVLYGVESGIYTDTLDVTPGDCFYELTGLNTGQTYYFAVMAVNSEGIGPLYLLENSGESYVEPRAPRNIAIEPDYQKLSLAWSANTELDLDHYKILRRYQGGNWSVIDDGLTSTAYDDMTVQGHVKYEYLVIAVDHDMNESDSSLIVGGMPATFDYPLLFVDETASNGPLNPSEEDQAIYYDSVFGELDYMTFSVGSDPDRIDRQTAGQYKNIFWFDDDVSLKVFSSSEDTMNWFLSYETNFCLAGYQSLYYIGGGSPQGPGDFVYDHFRISDMTVNQNTFDFIGATGLNGWPDIETREGIFGFALTTITTLDVAAGGEVIYTYNSNTGDPDFDGKPVGVIYDTGAGKRIAFGFPIFPLAENSAAALMAKIAEYFAIEAFVLNGDINSDENLNIMDVVYLINYLYKDGPAPLNMNAADPNGNCKVNILDAVHIINYLYRGGPQPLPGCVE